MIQYPNLPNQATIGVSAPSSGVPEPLHHLLYEVQTSMQQKGYQTILGDTAWTQTKSKSATAKKRAKELEEMLLNDSIDAIIPPWGGELLIEVLEHIDFSNIPPKWILGYSDTSALLLSITLKTGIATAHGTNIVDIRGKYSDPTTSKWEDVLKTKQNETIKQYSSEQYQKEWDFNNPTYHIFHLTERTNWKVINGDSLHVEGRLLGGCIDVIHHLVGTPYGDVDHFKQQYLKENEPIIWYLENCDLATPDLKRALTQMRYAGWFDHCSGILFGRSNANTPVDGYLAEDVYKEISSECGVPVAYDIDCGHMPPQITFVNGAIATVHVKEGKGTINQTFKS
ncbi:muramoyltetrapeptide carboxypeptidase LdcA involved in peptidoglycan recycling [Alkalibacillus filiformis]|uniref:Muramoyltetrapeptide carboxypeptidase LdcA involved in peptidoglycan recycling n=1 Tax=Alkalibacillus filiformis TaxID=200990 RepID=A0ABU0DUZ1_9BACI|nr:S66 peptidase family protein [Alkalibacillus filiformis]MDQ0352277.1 muramoyltetrapeptide carboxypeptidase LdcA involved in peptidoglycan recycling [Alkalibacillus filiformis]